KNQNLKGLITVKDITKKIKYPLSAKDSQGRLRVGAAIGATGDYLERMTELVRAKVDVIVVDTAHGHSSRVLRAVKEVKSRFAGDVTKALAAGADSVMIGSLFAGADESPGETILYQGRTYKSYRGMGSLGAMQAGSRDRYSQEQELPGKLVPEGIEGRVPYKGPISSLVTQLVGGLRSGMGDCGVSTITEVHTK